MSRTNRDIEEAKEDEKAIGDKNAKVSKNLETCDILLILKMTGETPEARSDKSLTLLTFGPMDQWTNTQMD